MIVLDTETTGLYADRNSLVSIGAVEFENPENQFYEECRIWDDAEVAQAALDVNGFSREDITDSEKQTDCSLLKSFFDWVEGCDGKTVAGHNVSFDLRFIDKSVERCELSFRSLQKRVVDTHSLAWISMIQNGEAVPEDDGYSGLNSDFIFKYVGITEERGEHDALEDAKLTAEAISRLAYGKQLLEEYKQFPIPWK